MELDHPVEIGRQAELGQGRRRSRNDAENRVGAALLLVGVGAEAADPFEGVGEVELHPLFEHRPLAVVEDAENQAAGVLGLDREHDLGAIVDRRDIHGLANCRSGHGHGRAAGREAVEPVGAEAPLLIHQVVGEDDVERLTRPFGDAAQLIEDVRGMGLDRAHE